MTGFTLMNWVLCLTTSMLLLVVFLRHRFLFVKPSIWVIVFFHLQIQWAATINSPYIESFLPNPWMFLLLANGFPLVGLIGSLGIGNRAALDTWRRIQEPETVCLRGRRKAAWLTASCIALFATYYLLRIPLSRTGLFVILTDPDRSTMAREMSLKLINDPLITYGYSFVVSVFGPLLGVLTVDSLFRNWRHKRFLRSLVQLTIFGLLLVAVNLYGARKPAALVIASVALAMLLRRGLSLNPVYVGLAGVAVLALPAVLTIIREGRAIKWSLFWTYLIGPMVRRVFYVPMRSGLYYAHYLQTAEPFGIRGMPNLSALLNRERIHVANHLALLYRPDTFESRVMNASFVFEYYSCFGIITVPFSLLGLWLLDGILVVYRRISNTLLWACVAVTSMACTGFISGRYTSTLFSKGFAVAPIVVLVLDSLHASRRRQQ